MDADQLIQLRPMTPLEAFTDHHLKSRPDLLIEKTRLPHKLVGLAFLAVHLLEPFIDVLVEVVDVRLEGEPLLLSHALHTAHVVEVDLPLRERPLKVVQHCLQ